MKSNRTWIMATVRGVRSVTPTVREITLEPEGGAERWAPGAHIDVEAYVSGRPALRSYSLIAPADASIYRIAVKRVEGSRGGSVFMTSLEVGARLSITAPKNDFELRLDAADYLLTAGGIGVTPIVAMALELERSRLPFRMLYAARDAQELAYGDLLGERLGDRLAIFLSGRGEMIQPASEIASLAPDGEAYVCGPSPLLTAFRDAWRTSARAPERLRFETFGNGGGFPSEPFRVRVPRRGIDILVKENETLLDALLGAGEELLSDCRRGECGLCAVDVLEFDGEIDHRDVFLGAEERRSNTRICACVSRAVGGGVVLDSSWRPDETP